MSSIDDLPEWERVLSAAARLQRILPEAVLVGGTAAATYAHHRRSTDADHVLTDLRTRFDMVLAELESVAGWQTARVNRPVLILGSLDGIETGIRQLIRKEPLETARVSVAGHEVTLPTAAEMLRIKSSLILSRNATRDYLDFVALAEHLGEAGTWTALRRLDELYPQQNGSSALQQLLIQLSGPTPFDLEAERLSEYKDLAEKWHDWTKVRGMLQGIAVGLLEKC
jgi:hypothetical protein